MIVKILIPLCVMLLMIIVGTGLQMKQFRVLMESPVPLLGGTLLQMVLLPAGALGIVFLIQPSIELAAGLLLVSACPGGALSNYYSHLGRLNVALSVMMTAISSLLAFAVLPVILAIVFPLIASVQQTEIPAAQLVRQLIVMLLVPIGVGMLIREFFRVIVEHHASRLRALGLVLVVLLLGLILFDQWEGATRLFTDALILAVLFTGIAVLAGWFSGFLTKQNTVDRYTFAVEFSVRNVGIAAVVAATALDRPEFVIFGALFVVIQFPLIMLLLFAYRARN